MDYIPKSVTVTTHSEVITVRADSKPVAVNIPSVLSATPIVTKVHVSKKNPRMALLEYGHYPNGEVQCLPHHGVQHMKIKSINSEDYVTVDDPVVVDFMVSEHNSSLWSI